MAFPAIFERNCTYVELLKRQLKVEKFELVTDLTSEFQTFENGTETA